MYSTVLQKIIRGLITQQLKIFLMVYQSTRGYCGYRPNRKKLEIYFKLIGLKIWTKLLSTILKNQNRGITDLNLNLSAIAD